MNDRLFTAALVAKAGWYLMFAVGCALFLYGVHLCWKPGAFLAAGILLAVLGFCGGLDPMRDWRSGE